MYYVFDADYQNKQGYLAPYKSYRHHLRDHRSRVRAHGAKDISNHADSSLGNIIGRSCGVLKACFPILKRITPYYLQTQVIIVIAAVTLSNYIRQESSEGLVI